MRERSCQRPSLWIQSDCRQNRALSSSAAYPLLQVKFQRGGTSRIVVTTPADRGQDPSEVPSHDGHAPQGARGDLHGLWHRLDVRFLLIGGLVLLAVMGTYDLFRLQRARRTFLAQREREVALLARAVEGPYLRWRHQGERGPLEQVLEDVREAKEAVCVGIYDPGGRLTIESMVRHLNTASTHCPEQFLAVPPPESALGRLTSPLDTVRFTAPLTEQDGEQVGTLVLALPTALIADPLRRQRTVLLVERLLILAALGLAFGLALYRLVTRPIRHLIRQAEEVGRGNLAVRLDVGTRTEIGDLARAFDRMAANLHESQERRLALERQVRHADKLALIGKLASEVAHEVGSPLNVISGRARILQRSFTHGEPQRESLDIIRTQVDRISRVIRRVLDVGRPPSTKQERVSLGPLLQEVATFVQPELRKNRVELRVDVPPGLPQLNATPDGLFQVMLNLIMNAAAAVPRGGSIEVVAARAGRPPTTGGATPGDAGIEIQVRDNGHGIDPSILPHLFDPFFSTRQGEGTGLGLSICRDIVREHGGWIGIESRPQEGTTARLWLPLEPQEVTHAAVPHSDHR